MNLSYDAWVTTHAGTTTIYDILGIATTRVCVSLLLLGIFHLFNKDIFKDEEYKFLLSYVTDRSAPPVVAPVSSSNSEPTDVG